MAGCASASRSSTSPGSTASSWATRSGAPTSGSPCWISSMYARTPLQRAVKGQSAKGPDRLRRRCTAPELLSSTNRSRGWIRSMRRWCRACPRARGARHDADSFEPSDVADRERLQRILHHRGWSGRAPRGPLPPCARRFRREPCRVAPIRRPFAPSSSASAGSPHRSSTDRFPAAKPRSPLPPTPTSARCCGMLVAAGPVTTFEPGRTLAQRDLSARRLEARHETPWDRLWRRVQAPHPLAPFHIGPCWWPPALRSSLKLPVTVPRSAVVAVEHHRSRRASGLPRLPPNSYSATTSTSSRSVDALPTPITTAYLDEHGKAGAAVVLSDAERSRCTSTSTRATSRSGPISSSHRTCAVERPPRDRGNRSPKRATFLVVDRTLHGRRRRVHATRPVRRWLTSWRSRSLIDPVSLDHADRPVRSFSAVVEEKTNRIAELLVAADFAPLRTHCREDRRRLSRLAFKWRSGS